jgi:serine/threonine protein kinase
MAPRQGTRLGPYEILGTFGAGGQGEVYRALDTRLDRTVAVKCVKGGLGEIPRDRARVEREARILAKLTHPNICALHDIVQQDGAGDCAVRVQVSRFWLELGQPADPSRGLACKAPCVNG